MHQYKGYGCAPQAVVEAVYVLKRSCLPVMEVWQYGIMMLVLWDNGWPPLFLSFHDVSRPSARAAVLHSPGDLIRLHEVPVFTILYPPARICKMR